MYNILIHKQSVSYPTNMVRDHVAEWVRIYNPTVPDLHVKSFLRQMFLPECTHLNDLDIIVINTPSLLTIVYARHNNTPSEYLFSVIHTDDNIITEDMLIKTLQDKYNRIDCLWIV